MSNRKSRRNRRRSKAKQDSNAGKLIIVGIILVALAIYSNWESSQPVEPLADAQTISIGAQVFQQNCAACHGDQGQGHAALAQAPALDGSEHSWHHPDGQIQDQILNGGVDMPSFAETLTNEEVIAVIRYFQTFWRADQLKAQQANSQQNPMVDQ